ncbi:MAG: universal stress protein [Lysobacterales bacterium]
MARTNRNIVVAVRDEINGRRALQRALAFACAETDSIHLVHAQRLVDLTRVVDLLQPRRTSADDQQSGADDPWLETLAGEARSQGREVQCISLSGRAGPAVAEYARMVRADLIVVASPREGLVRELFLGSSAIRILRAADCPVLVARNDPVPRYRCALLAIDNDPVATRVIAATGAFLAETTINLAHAYLVPEEYKLRMHGVSEETIADLRLARRGDFEQELQPLTRQLPQAILHFKHGFAPSVILELFNQLKPDIIVIGRHSGSALDEQVMGSVTQFLLYACNTDFLLVP